MRQRKLPILRSINGRCRPNADMRCVWGEYSERLRELTGAEYERVEHESWEQLQAELRELERERATLAEH